MSKLKASILAMTVVLGVAVTADAFAQRAGRGGGGGGGGRHYYGGGGGHHHHSGVSVGVAFGSPYWYGYGAPYYWPYYRPYYYPYPAAAAGYPAYAAGPAAYVEQAPPAPGAAAPAGYWYYCSESQAYYPHVQQCGVPWERVAPQPQS